MISDRALDLNGSRSWNSGDVTFVFGSSGDQAVSGDWDNNGKDEIGVYRNGTFYLDSDGSRNWNTGDASFVFGGSGCTPLSGDWNGDGKSEVAVFANGKIYRDKNGSKAWDSSDDYLTAGNAGVQALVVVWAYQRQERGEKKRDSSSEGTGGTYHVLNPHRRDSEDAAADAGGPLRCR